MRAALGGGEARSREPHSHCIRDATKLCESSETAVQR